MAEVNYAAFAQAGSDSGHASHLKSPTFNEGAKNCHHCTFTTSNSLSIGFVDERASERVSKINCSKSRWQG
jgi:hypothetical protein